MDEINWGSGVKVPMIKLVRQLTGMGLKEAKELVEQYPTSSETGDAVVTAREFRSRLDNLEALAARVGIPELELHRLVDKLEKENARLNKVISNDYEVRNLRDQIEREQNAITDLREELEREQEIIKQLREQDNPWREAIRQVIICLVEHDYRKATEMLLNLLTDRREERDCTENWPSRCNGCVHRFKDGVDYPCYECAPHNDLFEPDSCV